MSPDRVDALDEALDKLSNLPFYIPTYYQNFITRDIFETVIQDREQIREMLEGLKNGR